MIILLEGKIFLFFIFVNMCMRVCMHVCAFVCTHVSVHDCRRSQKRATDIPHITLSYSFRAGSLPKPGTYVFSVMLEAVRPAILLFQSSTELALPVCYMGSGT